MAETESKHDFDDELLSAYVDGELDQAQRAQVEQRLRDDPHAKQLVSELQSLSQTLRSLPRELVGSNLRDAVLQQVENKQATIAPREGGTSFSRRWTWAAMAVAAMLFLTIYQPQTNEEEKQLAKVESQVDHKTRSMPELRPPAETMAIEAPPTSEVAAVMAAAPAEALGESFVATDETEELCLIHLTLAEPQAGRQQFDALLMRNRIDPENVSSETEESSDDSQPPKTAPGDLAEAEVVLVEASRSQIEGLLEDCNADVRNWDSLSFADQADSRLPEPRWRGFERKRSATVSVAPAKVSESKAFGGALKADRDENNQLSSNESTDKVVKLRKSHAPRGRARRMDTDWYQSQVQRNVAADLSGRSRQYAKTKAAPGRQKETESAATDQIRVLFVLHPLESAQE